MITYEKAKEITEKSSVFYENIVEVTTPLNNTYKVSMFNYLLATGDDFVANEAHELRGLTFVHIETENGTKYQKHLALPKFFNLNENKYTLYEDFKDKEIISISLKEDGSLVQPIKMPDGSIMWKTKMSFDNPQTRMATEYFNKPENKHFKEYVEFEVDDNLPLFELVSPQNRIVVNYETTEIRLLAIRDKYFGGWGFPITINTKWFDTTNIPHAKQFNIPKKMLKVSQKWYKRFLGNPEDKERKTFPSFQKFIETVMEELTNNFPTEEMTYHTVTQTENSLGDKSCKLVDNIKPLDLLVLVVNYVVGEEGFVVTFKDLSKVKIKHTDYILKHKMFDNIQQEHIIIANILDETIDDILSFLPETDGQKQYINTTIHKLNNYIETRTNETMKLRFEYFNNYLTKEKNKDGEIDEIIDMPLFVYKNKTNRNFHILMKTKHLKFKEPVRDEVIKLIKEEIKFKTRRLELAREFLNSL